MRLKSIIFKLYGEKYEVKKKIKYGQNSQCFVVKKENNLFFLKLMYKDNDIDYYNERIPKLILKGEYCYKREPYCFRLNEFIDGSSFARLKKLTMELLKEIISLFYSIHKEGICVIDMHKHNFIKSKNGKVYYVDSGGIKEIKKIYGTFCKPYYFALIEPQEYFYQEGADNPKYNEKVEIFYLGLFLKETFKFLEKECIEVLDKMTKVFINERYNSFEDIYKLLFEIS